MTQRIFAFKGTFGQFETYTGSIPTQRLGAMFSAYFADALDANDPMLRAQRVIDMGHVRRINGYLDRSVRAFGSPIATAKVISETPVAGVPNLVEVELTDIYLVDGQKRVKSCILRAEQDPEWNETIPLHVVGTEELIHKQQLFASINGTAAKVSPSLNAIYDHSNPLGGFITMNCPAEVMESEKATVSKTSDKLVTPGIFKEAMAGLLGVSLKQLASLSLDRLESSWDKWAPYTRELWQVYRELSKEAGGLPMLRLLSILPHNVGFLAICRVFPLLRNPAQLHDLVRWERAGLTARASGLWDGRCMTLGKITKSGDAVALTAAMLATQLGVELDDNLKLFL